MRNEWRLTSDSQNVTARALYASLGSGRRARRFGGGLAAAVEFTGPSSGDEKKIKVWD